MNEDGGPIFRQIAGRDRERDRRRVPRRGDPGALVQRAGRLPPHQPRHRGQGPQPARDRRGPLQETRSRDVRRHRRPRAAAQAPAQRVRRPVPPSADDRGRTSSASPPAELADDDRRLGGARDDRRRHRCEVGRPCGSAGTTALDDVTTTIETRHHHRAARPQRRRQDHADAAAHRPPRADRRHASRSFGARPLRERRRPEPASASSRRASAIPTTSGCATPLDAAAGCLPRLGRRPGRPAARATSTSRAKRAIKKLSRGMTSAVGHRHRPGLPGAGHPLRRALPRAGRRGAAAVLRPAARRLRRAPADDRAVHPPHRGDQRPARARPADRPRRVAPGRRRRDPARPPPSPSPGPPGRWPRSAQPHQLLQTESMAGQSRARRPHRDRDRPPDGDRAGADRRAHVHPAAGGRHEPGAGPRCPRVPAAPLRPARRSPDEPRPRCRAHAPRAPAAQPGHPVADRGHVASPSTWPSGASPGGRRDQRGRRHRWPGVRSTSPWASSSSRP